jgi:hypothetical protein
MIGCRGRYFCHLHQFFFFGTERVLVLLQMPGLQERRKKTNMRNGNPSILLDRCEKHFKWFYTLHIQLTERLSGNLYRLPFSFSLVLLAFFRSFLLLSFLFVLLLNTTCVTLSKPFGQLLLLGL